ncbi:extracellular solute-binding protein [Iocasia frigidifontis]|uniref:Extracellular solute-binding protein n=1 Tax=Iocasia fonsfrigidae TaxID=2682810 RepID=A0A8A7K6A8_9FIRM|nr:sugar ABC transporter substrate-binding protein [Iocasia fonsfrigidae]QTL97313.1 extracellular solute-binding protein [Iocasia fonsfrigidae]
MRKVLFVLTFTLLLVLTAVNVLAQTDITYWLWLDDPTDPTIKNLVEEYNKTHPDINVNMEMIPMSQYHDRLATALATNSGPDVARFKIWWLGEFEKAGLLEGLDNYINSWDMKNDVIDNLWDTGKVPGKDEVYMMPHQFISFYMYYRQDWFEENGLSEPVSFADMLEAGKAFTDPDEQRYGFALRGGAGGGDQWLAFMLAGGARVIDEDGNVIINNDTAVEVNQLYIDLFRKHHIAPPTCPTDGFAQIMGGFQSGNTAMAMHHVGSSKTMQEALGDNVAVTAIPQKDPDNPATIAAMSGHVMFKTSAKKDAAFKFMSWMTEKRAMEKWTNSADGQLPVLKSVARMPKFQDDPFYKVSMEAADYAKTWPPLPGVGYITSSLWQELMQKALLGEISSQEMLDQIAENIQ